MRREWNHLVQDMIDAIDDVERFTLARDRAGWSSDVRTRYAVSYALLVIGEAASAMPEEVRAAAPHVPWRAMRGLRNVLAHAYFDVDPDALWRTVTDDLGPVRALLVALIAADDG